MQQKVRQGLRYFSEKKICQYRKNLKLNLKFLNLQYFGDLFFSIVQVFFGNLGENKNKK